MSAGEYCTREVVVVSAEESVQEAVALMRSHHVGDVVVLDSPGSNPHPIGILTDRDIVLEVLAQDVKLEDVRIGDIMNNQPVTVPEDTKLLSCLELMRHKGIRRLLVVDRQGKLAGILTIEDILELVAEQLDDIVAAVTTAKENEQHMRP